MATRRERVVLDLQDNFTAGVARAAAASKLLDGALNDLSGHAVRAGRDLDAPAKGADRLGQSSRKAGPDIDRLSGRLRLLTDAAATLGPAIIPLGAASIPVLTGALAGMGAAAGAIGATVLAFNGLGDALKAIDKAELEPTAENLQAMRVELERLGPAGEDFARYLSRLGPAIDDLQNTARGQIFPGLTDGFESLRSRGPEVEKIINRLADGMGDLAADAGRALASDEWTPFFEYVKNTARPTLDDFARSMGNIVLGVANMLVAFDPLTQSFTGGLRDATEAFAEWSTTLDTNQSFQEFLAFVQESGPQAVEFLGALVTAFVGLAQAAAPVGQIVLPALTGIAQVFGAIAASDIGPGLYTAAAALIAFNRASIIAERSSARLQTTWAGLSRARIGAGVVGGLGLLATSLTDVDEKLGLANTAMYSMAGLMVGGPWGAGIGAAVGLVQDFTGAQSAMNDELERTDAIARTGTLKEQRAEYERLKAEIDEAKKAQDDYWTTTDFSTSMLGLKSFIFGLDDQEAALANLGDSMKNAGGLAVIFGRDIGMTGEEMEEAAASASDFSGALAELAGWLDRREALRNYKDSVKELGKGLKDGFDRETVEQIDATGRAILQVAEGMKDPVSRANFLVGARASLEELAQGAGPKARAEIERLIAKMDQLGVTHPKPDIDANTKPAEEKLTGVERQIARLNRQTGTPTADLDDNPFQALYGQVEQDVNRLDGKRARPSVSIDPGNSIGILGQITNLINGIRSKSVTITTHMKRTGSITSGGVADGGTIGGPRMPYGDKVPYLLAPGEEVISNRFGQADRHRALLKAINANRAADGTTVPNVYTSRRNAGSVATDGVERLNRVSWQASEAIKEFNNRLVDNAKAARDAAIQRRDALASGIASGLGGDIWEGSSGSVWAAGATGGNSPQAALARLNEQKARAQRLVAAINTLRQKGVTGPVLAEIIGTGDVERAEAMAAMDLGFLAEFSSAYNSTQSALAAAGAAGGNAAFGDDVARTTAELREIQKELRALRGDVKDADKNNQRGHDRNAERVAAGVNGAASDGKRRGKR